MNNNNENSSSNNNNNNSTDSVVVNNNDDEQSSPKVLLDLIKELASDIKKLKEKDNLPQIATSPLRDNLPPLRENEHSVDDSASENGDAVSVVVTDHSDDETINSIPPSGTITNDIFKNIKTASMEDNKGPAVDNNWGNIVNQNWSCKKDEDSMKKLRSLYPIPSNCELIVPKLNIELWELINSTQRKSDVTFSQIQRNLTASVAASLAIATDVLSNKFDKKNIIQTTANLVALLGEASSEISKKRKLFIRSVLKDEYKDLTSLTTETTKNLFGDNLAQNIKDLNLRNKLELKSYSNYSKSSNKPYNRQNYKYGSSTTTRQNYSKDQSFLGERRRSWNSSHTNNNNKNFKKK